MVKNIIKLNRKVYKSKEASLDLNRDFSEFKPKKYTVKEFFELYDSLFYDILQTGGRPGGTVLAIDIDEGGYATQLIAEGPGGESPTEGYYVTNLSTNNNTWISSKNTHRELVEKSKEYIGAPPNSLDEEIQELLKQIELLNNEINNTPSVHPFFKEGDIIEDIEAPYTKYYIQGGNTRPIYNSSVFKTIKSAAGFSKSDSDKNITIPMNIQGIESIGSSPLGPIYSKEDL